MKNVISLREVVDCDAFLKEKCLNFRIHLRDACGKQSCWIEPLCECGCDGQYEELYAALEDFFGKLRYKLEYSDDKLNFWLSNE